MSDKPVVVFTDKELIRKIRNHVGHKGKSTKVVFFADDREPQVLGRKSWNLYRHTGRGGWWGEYVPSTRRIEVGLLSTIVTNHTYPIKLNQFEFKRAVKI